MIGYYDRAGNPLDQAGGMAAFGRDVNRTVAYTRITGGSPPQVFEVSTVHLVLDHGWGDGPPIIFETMVFGPDGDEWGDFCDRYTTEQQARNGHTAVVVQVTADLSRPVVMDIDPAELHASRMAAALPAQSEDAGD